MPVAPQSKTRGLYKRGTVWWCGYLAPIFDDSGRLVRRADGSPRSKVVYQSTGKKLKSEGRAVLDRWRGAAADALAHPDAHDEAVATRETRAARSEAQRFTMTELAELWMTGRAQGKAKKSQIDDRRFLNELIAEFGADTPVVTLTPAQVAAYRDKLTAEGKAGPTVNRRLGLLRSALNWARSNGHDAPHIVMEPHRQGRKGALNPAGVRLMPEPARDRVLTRREANLLIEAAPPKLRIALAIAYYAGLRRGEIAKLRHSDFDLEANELRVRPEVSKTAAERIVPLADELRDELARFGHQPDGPGFLLPALPRGRRMVETNHDRPGHIDPSTLSSGLAKIITRFADTPTPLPKAGLHDFRRSFITDMGRSGSDAHLVSRIAGGSIETIGKHYRQVIRDEMHKAIQQRAVQDGH